jgi:uncharacterized protein YjdB
MPTCTVVRVDVQPHPLGIKKGGTAALVAIAYDVQSSPQHGTTFTWASDNTAIATVSAAGVVTAVKQGTANIIATPSSGPTGSALVNVYN